MTDYLFKTLETMNRFTRAVDLLYKAFEEDTLDAMDCRHCAVGNMCHNSHKWAEDGIGNFTDIGKRNPPLEIQEMTGYSASEITSIECLFLYGTPNNNCNNRAFQNNRAFEGTLFKEENRELEFKGLIAVIDYLAQLEGEETPSSIVDKFKACLDAPVKVLVS